MFDRLTRHVRERRKAPRFRGHGIRVNLQGKRVSLLDVSASGLRVRDLADAPAVGQQVEGRMAIRGAASGPFVAEVVWVDGSACGLRFLEIAPAVFLGLQGYRPADARS